MHLLIPILIIFWQSKNWTPQRRGSFNAIHCIKVDAKVYGSEFWGIFPQTSCMKFNDQPVKKNWFHYPTPPTKHLFMWKKTVVCIGMRNPFDSAAKWRAKWIRHPVCFTICIWGWGGWLSITYPFAQCMAKLPTFGIIWVVLDNYFPIASMYGIFTYIYPILLLKTPKCR